MRDLNEQKEIFFLASARAKAWGGGLEGLGGLGGLGLGGFARLASVSSAPARGVQVHTLLCLLSKRTALDLCRTLDGGVGLSGTLVARIRGLR